MSKIKEIIKYILLREKSSSERYIQYLKNIGCRIGSGTYIYASPRDVLIDPTRPFLIDIGKNVQITRNVTILTHGYDWSVLKGVYGDVLGSSGKVTIGDNVFIGMNATILKGTTIGDNCIIGANSLLRGTYPSNSVIVGNPAKVLCSIEEYYEKRKAAQISEAIEIAKEYMKCYKKRPNKEVFEEFFWLFEKRDKNIHEAFDRKMQLVQNYEISYNKFLETNPMFNSYDEFLDYCYTVENDESV